MIGTSRKALNIAKYYSTAILSLEKVLSVVSRESVGAGFKPLAKLKRVHLMSLGPLKAKKMTDVEG